MRRGEGITHLRPRDNAHVSNRIVVVDTIVDLLEQGGVVVVSKVAIETCQFVAEQGT